jgi:hypothetical protein
VEEEFSEVRMLYHGDVAENQGNNNAGGAVERVTLTEAAALLGCHRNTVKNRIQAGIYHAEKVHTENGLTWMIERDSLTNKTPTIARQQGVGGVPAIQQEALQELARAIVMESGIAQDPEREVRLENDKARADLFRTMAFLNTALLAGTAGTVAFLQEPQHITLLVVSFLSNIVGITFALGGLVLATILIGETHLRPTDTAAFWRPWRERIAIAAVLLFGIALLAFEVFAVTNFRALL